MARDYKSESDWQKKKYERVQAYIDKELGTLLKEKLKKENITIASWITTNAKKYIAKK